MTTLVETATGSPPGLTRPQLRRATGYLLAAGLAGTVQHRWPARRPDRRRPVAAVAWACAAPFALLGTRHRLVAQAWRHRRHNPTPTAPLDAAARLGLLLATVVVEETLWRWPLLHAPRVARSVAAVVATGGFVAAHAARDTWPAALAVHLPLAVGWTASTVADGTVLWPVVTHACYNLAAQQLRSSARLDAECCGPAGLPR